MIRTLLLREKVAREGRNGGKKEKNDENSAHYVIASSRCLNADRWNAARSCQCFVCSIFDNPWGDHSDEGVPGVLLVASPLLPHLLLVLNTLFFSFLLPFTHTTHSQPQVLGAEYWFVVLRDFLNNIIERFLVRLALASRQSVTVLFLVSDCSAVRLSCTELCWIFCSVAQSLQHLH